MSDEPAQVTDTISIRRPNVVTAERIILLAALALLFAGLGTRSLWHLEGRWAEVTREMFLTGDFFHPTIGGEPYFDKPLLTYWPVAVVAAITGRLNEWTARFPSAVSGLVVLWATMWLGRRLWSRRVGALAGIILLTSYGFLFWSRMASADLENLAAIMLAVAWYWRCADRPNFTAFLGFYLIAFLGALAKGLPAIVIPVLAILPDLIMRPRWRKVLTVGHAVAFLIGLSVYLAPFLYAAHTRPDNYEASGLALVLRENILRFIQPFDHQGPVYLYFYYLPLLLLPWAPLFLASIVGLFKLRREMDHATQWLVWASIVIFAFFTASGCRRGYYIVPLLPFCALMIGVVFAKDHGVSLGSVWRHGIRAQAILLVGAVLLQLLGGPLSPRIAGRYGVSLPRSITLSMPVIATAAMLAGFIAFRVMRKYADARLQRLGAMGGLAVALMGGLFCWQQGALEVFRTERPFVQKVAERAKDVPPGNIGVYRNNSAIMLFYLDAPGHVAVLRNADELRDFLSGEDQRVVFTLQKFKEDAHRAAPDALAGTPDMVQQPVPWTRDASDDDWVVWWYHPKSDQVPAAGLVENAHEK